MTDEIDKRIAIDSLLILIRTVATDCNVVLEPDSAIAIRGILEDTFAGPEGLRPSDHCVESVLLNYDPVPPYRVYVSDIAEPITFARPYRSAQNVAREHWGARRVSVFIRDAADVVTWEIRVTDTPLGE